MNGTTHRVEVFYKPGFSDPAERGILHDARDLGIRGLKKVRKSVLYRIEGGISGEELRRGCRRLLLDPLTQDCEIDRGPDSADGKTGRPVWRVEVWPRPGVTDAVGDSVKKGFADIGIEGVRQVAVGESTALQGAVDLKSVREICRRLLANDIIQTCCVEKA